MHSAYVLNVTGALQTFLFAGDDDDDDEIEFVEGLLLKVKIRICYTIHYFCHL